MQKVNFARSFGAVSLEYKTHSRRNITRGGSSLPLLLRFDTIAPLRAEVFGHRGARRGRRGRRGLKGIWPWYVMNIFAYQGRYRTVTATRYIGVQVWPPAAKYACISPGGQPSMPPQPTPMHITLGRENCRLVCKLGTCIPRRARVYIFLSICSSVEFRA